MIYGDKPVDLGHTQYWDKAASFQLLEKNPVPRSMTRLRGSVWGVLRKGVALDQEAKKKKGRDTMVHLLNCNCDGERLFLVLSCTYWAPKSKDGLNSKSHQQ